MAGLLAWDRRPDGTATWTRIGKMAVGGPGVRGREGLLLAAGTATVGIPTGRWRPVPTWKPSAPAAREEATDPMITLRWPSSRAYAAGMLALGFQFRATPDLLEEYFVAKRSMPAWAMGLSVFATIITSISFIAYPGNAYAGNWAELVAGFMALAALRWPAPWSSRFSAARSE